MKIAIDFDGVIIKHDRIPTGGINFNDPPMEGALESINLFIKQGCEVVVVTSNPRIEKIRSWLKKHSFPELRITNIKEPVHVIIDDRAIRFTNWQDIRKYFV
jgi:hypothetical protein